MALSPVIIAMLLGILSSSLLNLANVMQRHGIEVFDQIRSKLKKESSDVEGGAKKPTIYIIGVLLNQTPPLWATLSNATGAPTSYYTGVFGLGMIVLLIYSSKVLHESIKKIEYIGAAILILGTVILGIDGIIRPELDMSIINIPISFTFIGILILFGILGMTISLKKNTPMLIGIIFGLFAGAIGSLDPVLKGIGQNYGVAGGLPSEFVGWVIYILSFSMGFGAFTITQWGFARKADATAVLPSYNSMYVIIPIIIQILALPGFNIYWTTIVGMIITVIGIVVMTINHEQPPKKQLKL